MNLDSIVAYSGAAFGAVLALAAIFRPRRTPANWLFLGGMAGLVVESISAGLALSQVAPAAALDFQRMQWLLRSASTAFWIGFSLTYSRGNYREFLLRWRPFLFVAAGLPLLLLAVFLDELFQPVTGAGWHLGPAGKVLNLWLLVAAIVILMNLEKTFRAAVGTMRWRIKFVVLGLCVIFGAKIYVLSQAALYSTITLPLAAVEPAALLLGCGLIAVSVVRSRLLEIDVYPSRSLIYHSLTITLTGVYLLVVGVLARVVAEVGGDKTFPLKSLLMMLGIVGLSVVLLSDRIRQRTERLVSRHFKRPLYDHRKVWAAFTETTVHATNQTELCAATAKLVSDTFNILSVTIWLADESRLQLEFAASTALRVAPAPEAAGTQFDLNRLLAALREQPQPFDLDASKTDWAEQLRQSTPSDFQKGGHRLAVPIVASDRALGVIILADRVSGLPFSVEELELLRCIGNHVAASLLGLQLAEELLQAREHEAFKAVSAFFAHDLKNSASTLSLMLQNLPLHFDDPDFRQDVLRGIAKTVNHMNHLISQLSVFRQKPELHAVPGDLNTVVSAALSTWPADREIELVQDLQPLPPLPLDAEQMQKVVTNLMLNARDAVGAHGQILVQTAPQNGWATLSVRDDGCGMAPEFLRQSLFRPFQTTKKGGTGIGLFQCKTIVEAHRGRIEVDSEPGKGTTFRVLLPLTILPAS